MDSRDPLDLVAEDVAARLRRGETPTLAEYVARHPEVKDELEGLFPTLMLMERARREVRTSATAPLLAPLSGRDVPKKLGDFRLVREVGRGGMGIVYEAVQESLGRRVALKALPPGARSAKAAERFEREAQAAATLHHTNIVQVFGVGEQDGVSYYVMQLVEGRSLEQIVEGRGGDGAPLEPRRAARIAAQVGDALGHAHARGVLHRDVKPANVLLDAQDQAWITDFGLAKVLGDDDAGLTDTGDVLGTVRYLPPERLEGVADERGDVYGLGLVLYELVTGRRAFAGVDRAEILRLIREVGPAAPSSVRPGLPRDLETILLRAIAREPRDRYPTARALADDLRRWLEDRPIAARRAGPVERAWRWCRRNRALATLGAIAVASLLVASITGWRGYVVTTAALKSESALLAQAETARRRAVEDERLSRGALEGIFHALAGDDRLGPRGPSPQDEQSDEAALLQTVLTFYEGYAARNQADPRLQLEAARSYRRVGLIRARLGQADGAAEAYATALDRFEGLRAAAPGDPTYELELAVTLLALAAPPGDAPEPAGDPAVDEERVRRAIALLEGPAAKPAATRPDLLVAARARHAVALARLGRVDDARAALDAARLARPALPSPPTAGSWPMQAIVGLELSRAGEALGVALVARGEHEAGLALFQEALTGLMRGRSGGGRRQVPRLLDRVAACHRALGRDDAAAEVEAMAEEARRTMDRRGRGRGQGPPPTSPAPPPDR